MKLIIDEAIDVNVITEAATDGAPQSMYISGIFAQAEKKNRNGRIYTKSGVLEPAVAQYNTEYIATKRAIGELNHPATPIPNPAEACILVEELTWDNLDVIGKAKVLSTPKGMIVQNLINDGVQMGVSTRGLGTTSNKANNVLVNGDYSIKAIDVVWNPSGIDCYVNGILENVDFYFENGVVTEKEAEEMTMSNTTYKKLSESFEKFMLKIKGI